MRTSSPTRLSAVALLAAGALVLGSGMMPTAQAATFGDGLIVAYDFTEGSGTTLTDRALDDGAQDGTVVGGAAWNGASMTFTGANHVRLPNDLLAGKTAASVVVEMKPDASVLSGNNFLWNLGGSGEQATGQFFVHTAGHRTAISATNWNGEQGVVAPAAFVADQWQSVAVTIEPNADPETSTIVFYVDGVEVGRHENSTVGIADLPTWTKNLIGASAYDADAKYTGEISAYRLYDRALGATEVASVAESDAAVHADSFLEAAQRILDGIDPVTIDDSVLTLPDFSGTVTWTSSDPALWIDADGRTVHVTQPEPGEPAINGTLTATATVRGATASRDIAATITPQVGEDIPYGYLMVHFIEDSAGYAEKIYLDISRGDNPEQWDPLNGGQPILASPLGTTGVRDPFLTRNPETGMYYIIATDLRVFGGDSGSGNCRDWCHWSTYGSSKLNVWESADLITWSPQRQIDVGADATGARVAELGMAWAPEATWVEDYYPDGRGAFVFYWSSNLYELDDPAHATSTYNRVLWGATTDFTQETYEYGGVFIDIGGNSIDTTITQNDGVTYRVTKDNAFGTGLYMESTSATRWWEPEAEWIRLQDRIGAEWAGNNPGGVEGPAIFKRTDEDVWYLYVDVIPTTGYRPMVTTDLDAGWSLLESPDFYMAPSTKHGGIIALTRAQYEAIRGADATAATATDLGSLEVEAGMAPEDLRAALPGQAEVDLAYGRGVGTLPVDWDLSAIDLSRPGTHTVTGTIRTIGANLNTWVGEGGSTAWNAPGRTPFSDTALTVTASVVVTGEEPVAPLAVATTTRCVAGKVVLVATVTNESDEVANGAVETAFGSRTFTSLAPGTSVSVAFSTRQPTIDGGDVTVHATLGDASAPEEIAVSYEAVTSCG